MSTVTQNNLKEDERYIVTLSRNTYYYASSRLRQLGFLSEVDLTETARDIAADCTVDLITKLREGIKIEEDNYKKYVLSFVKNYLRRVDFARFAARRRDSADVDFENLGGSEQMHLDGSDGVFTLDGLEILEPLDNRQKRVVRLREEGYKCKEIAEFLNLSAPTISRILGEIMILTYRRHFLSDK